MNKKESVLITKEDVYKDPYNYEFEDMCNALGKEEAERLFFDLYKKSFQKKYQTIFVKHIYKSQDTLKYVYELPDRRCIETVCIKRKDGVTACVSTQVGCPVQCVFCESGRNGFIRNLTASEIVQQIRLLNNKINRIVFMGMGEPLFNYHELIKAIHILRDRHGLNFPTDGITVSTVGPLEQLKKLREEHLKIQLTISLHATTQKVRNKLMPGMRKNSIEKIVESALDYSQRHNRTVVIAYLLLPGVNDKPSDVIQLKKWFAGKNIMINLLQYNNTSSKNISRPNKQVLTQFKKKLEAVGLKVKIRESHGKDVNAACGQLVSKYNKSTNEKMNLSKSIKSN